MAKEPFEGPTLPMLFPHAVYAEDQHYPHTILTIHCLHRGFTAGAILGLIPPLTRSAFNTVLRRPLPPHPLPYVSRIFSSAAIGGVGGIAFLAIGMIARMWGREEVEWQDRSWRILANKSQNREDGYSFSGIVIGAMYMAFRTRRGHLTTAMFKIPRWRAIVGAAATGSIAGTLMHVLTSSLRFGQDGVENLENKVAAGAGPLKPE